MRGDGGAWQVLHVNSRTGRTRGIREGRPPRAKVRFMDGAAEARSGHQNPALSLEERPIRDFRMIFKREFACRKGGVVR